MSYRTFLPEGSLIHTDFNNNHTASPEKLRFAMENHLILEGTVMLCDSEHNLIVDVNGYRGIIPHDETAIGITDGSTREIAIISRVGKPVSIVINGIDEKNDEITLMLSRCEAQKRALSHIISTKSPGDIIPAKVTHLEPFGAFVDIGCGNISLIGIETISVSRISHPKDRFKVGTDIFAVISHIDSENKRISLSHKELLGTWSENVSKFQIGQTVRGIVRGIENYGVFVELAPNLSGLAEYHDDVRIGDCVSAYIKSIIPDKMKIKLVIIDVFENEFENTVSPEKYFLTSGKINLWKYSPKECTKKQIFSEF